MPRWSAATEAFWRKSLDQCRRRGQILAIGAGIPSQVGGRKNESEKLNELKSFDFGGAIAALQNMDTPSAGDPMAVGVSVTSQDREQSASRTQC